MEGNRQIGAVINGRISRWVVYLLLMHLFFPFSFVLVS